MVEHLLIKNISCGQNGTCTFEIKMFRKTISDWIRFKNFLCVPGAPCAKPKVEHIFFSSTAYRYIGGCLVKTRYGTSINLRRAPTSRTLVHVFGNDLKSFSFFQIPNKINATINYGLPLKRIKTSTFRDFLKIDSLSKFQLIIFIAWHFFSASTTAPKRDPICNFVSFRCGFTTVHFI